MFLLRAAGIQAAVVALLNDIKSFTVQAERLGAEVAVAALADWAFRLYSAYEVGYGHACDLVSVLAPVLLLAKLRAVAPFTAARAQHESVGRRRVLPVADVALSAFGLFFSLPLPFIRANTVIHQLIDDGRRERCFRALKNKLGQ